MTPEERIEVIGSTWEMLPQGLWCLVETPTACGISTTHPRLPFFHWLPDDLALLRSRHGPARASARYRVLMRPHGLDFTRWGRA